MDYGTEIHQIPDLFGACSFNLSHHILNLSIKVAFCLLLKLLELSLKIFLFPFAIGLPFWLLCTKSSLGNSERSNRTAVAIAAAKGKTEEVSSNLLFR
jgi:hypothetical protein